MAERRDALKQDYARDWEKMERRHAAERIRDERMIERKRSEGSRGRSGEIARKSFRVRANADTAQHTPAPSERDRMAKALSEAARKAESESIMDNKTVIAIAHRLSTLRQMDRIIVMEAGKIIEDGTHDELIAIKNGHYAKLWSMQSGGFLGDK